jgi:hypothetical protein
MGRDVRDMISTAKDFQGQVAAEIEYLEKVKKDLIGEEYAVEKGDVKVALKDEQKAERLLNGSVGRTSRRIYQDGSHVLQDEEALAKFLPKSLIPAIKSFETHLRTELAYFVKELNRRNGAIVRRVHASLPLLKAKPVDQKAVLAAVTGILEEIGNVEKWLQGADAEDERYIAFLKQLDEI